jgi:hypothetical protein
MPFYEHALHALRGWMDLWAGVGQLHAGLHHGSGLRLTNALQHPTKGRG